MTHAESTGHYECNCYRDKCCCCIVQEIQKILNDKTGGSKELGEVAALVETTYKLYEKYEFDPRSLVHTVLKGVLK